MNRRNLFKLIAGAACAAAIEMTGLVPALPRSRKFVVNPEYLTAEYEEIFLYTDKTMLMVERVASAPSPWVNGWGKAIDETRPRFTFENGKYIRVPQCIEEK